MASLTLNEQKVADLYAELHAYAELSFTHDHLLPGFRQHLSSLGLSPDSALRGKSFLDAGCGGFAGGVAVALALGAEPITGIDLSLENVRAARRRFTGCPRVAFLQQNLRALAVPSDSFDFVYCVGVLHHTEDPKSCLRELVRVLRPDGRIYLGVYGRGGIYNELLVPAVRLAGRVTPRRLIARLLKFTPWLLQPSSSLMDVMYVPIAHHYRRPQVEQWFTEVGLEPTFLRHYYQADNFWNRLLFGEGTMLFFTASSLPPRR